MKRTIRALTILSLIALLTGLFFSCSNPSGSSEVTYEVGDTGPAGGIIIYDDEADGTDDIADYRYLEMAPDDCSGTYAWTTSSFWLGTTSKDIGEGKNNTEEILSNFGSTVAEAAAAADSYTNNGYSDWFLPSNEEFNLIIDLDSEFDDYNLDSNKGYWQSSEYSTLKAYYCYGDYYNAPSTGTISTKTQHYTVRAIRQF